MEKNTDTSDGDKIPALKTDAELIRAFRAGSERAFDLLTERYISYLYNFLFFFMGSSDEASDIVQEAFYKIWKNFAKYDESQSFKTWATSIARNTAIDYLRKKKPLIFSRIESEDSSEPYEHAISDEAPLAPEIFEKEESKKLVEEAILSLSEHYRRVLVLRYMDDMSFEEIAEALKKPLNTVKSQHRRGLMVLRKYLENAPK